MRNGRMDHCSEFLLKLQCRAKIERLQSDKNRRLQPLSLYMVTMLRAATLLATHGWRRFPFPSLSLFCTKIL